MVDRVHDSRKTSRPWYDRLLRVLKLFVICYLIVVLLAMFFEESLIFFPSRYPRGNWQPSGVSFEDAEFQAADGTRLHGWFAPHNHPSAVILFCHGNAGNVTNRAETLRILNERLDAAVLVFDYRGYGRSEGKPNETGILADARAARTWLADQTGVDEQQIVIMGRSLGGGVAVDLAAEDGARALVLESTFSSMRDVAASHYPWLPVRLAMRTRLDSARKIASYEGPLLQSHGNADTIVPYRFGRRLFDSANEPKQFFEIDNSNHNDPQPLEYYDVLDAFLRDLP